MYRLRIFSLIALVLTGINAQAASISCPGTVSTSDREFSVNTTPSATCLASGTGNINGNAMQDPFLMANSDYVLIDKSDGDGTDGLFPDSFDNPTSLTSGLSGSFTFTPPPGYTNFVIAFKSGEGQLDPDWAAFLLPNGVVTGTWAITGNQALSHANIYAQVVPLPAAAWLFLSAMGGLFGIKRFKRA